MLRRNTSKNMRPRQADERHEKQISRDSVHGGESGEPRATEVWDVGSISCPPTAGSCPKMCEEEESARHVRVKGDFGARSLSPIIGD